MKLKTYSKRGLLLAAPVLALVGAARATETTVDGAVNTAMTAASSSVSNYAIAGVGIAAIIFAFIILARLLKRGL